MAQKRYSVSNSCPDDLCSSGGKGEGELSPPSLPEFMQDLGLPGCATVGNVLEVFSKLGLNASNLSDAVIAQTIGMMAKTQSRLLAEAKLKDINAIGWDVGNFCEAVREIKKTAPVDWESVMRELDYDDFFVFDFEGVQVIFSAYKAGIQRPIPFTVDVVLGKWRNIRGQASLLRQSIFCSSELVDFTRDTTDTRRVLLPEADQDNLLPAMLTVASALASHKWNSARLFDLLCHLMGTTEAGDDAKEILEKMAKMSPELVFLGLLQAKDGARNEAKLELLRRLFYLFLTGHPNSSLVLAKLHKINPSMLVGGLLEMYEKDKNSISRILDIAQDLKITSQLLEILPFAFALDLAALASRREFINLDKWLQDMAARHGEEFIRSCLAFVERKIVDEVKKQTQHVSPTSSVLSMDLYIILLRFLERTIGTEGEFKELHNKCLQVFPRLMNLSSEEMSKGETTFSSEIEQEVNTHYERVYRGEVTVEATIDMLRQLRESSNPRHGQIFACVIHNLFDEYRFFPKYPDKELTITANLFGSLIRYGLVSHTPLGVALRYVLDALRQNAHSRMFKFGVMALSQFQSRLAEWPNFCQNLLRVESLKLFRPQVLQEASRIVAAAQHVEVEEPVEASTPSGAIVAIRPEAVSIEGSDDNQTTPSDVVMERILFILNNLAENTLNIKLNELTQVLSESNHQWFANYVVVKRASTELNQHPLYLKMLERLARPNLSDRVLRETLLNARILLNSPKTLDSSDDRNVLKNLGSWLGGLTLARDIPIRHKHLSLKDVLIEGYESGRLFIVIPFVCKVLMEGKCSRVFKPPNPWIITILGLLAELYSYAEIKIKSKYEIEMLFRAFDLTLTGIEPSTILRSSLPRTSGSIAASSVALPPPPAAAPIANTNALNVAHSAGEMPTMKERSSAIQLQTQYLQNPMHILDNMMQYIVFDPHFHAYLQQPMLQRLLYAGVEQGFREVLPKVLERAQVVACAATVSTVVRDFALEPNEEKMRKAAHLMARQVAGSFAAALSREALRVAIEENTRELLVSNGFLRLDELVNALIEDNLEFLCEAIKRASADDVVTKIDDHLCNQYLQRQKQRLQGQPFYDMMTLAMMKYPLHLPDTLKIKSTGLTLQQLRVYDEFYTMEAPLTDQQALDRFNRSITELDLKIGQCNSNAWGKLPLQHDIRLLVRQISLLAEISPQRDHLALMFAQRIVQLLYKSESDIAREIYVMLLEHYCSISPKTAKEVTQWLTYADDERKYNVPVTVALIRKGLVKLSELDAQLAALIEQSRVSVAEFAVKLVRLIFEELPNQEVFPMTLRALALLAQRGKASDSVFQLLDELAKRRQLQQREREQEAMNFREQLAFVFSEWVRLYQHQSSNEKAFMAFVQQLQQGVFKSDDTNSLFFRIATETAISSDSLTVDALSKLIAVLVRFHEGSVDFFSRVLTIILLVLCKHSKDKQLDFDQRPFYRLLSGILVELGLYEQQFSTLGNLQLMLAFATFAHTLRPAFVPSFAFAWLALISHRLFLPKLLLSEDPKCWESIFRLLLDLFHFLGPLLKPPMKESTVQLYKGANCVILLLLHDFPAFLCSYYFSLCEVIPESCIQLRNMVLNAYPPSLGSPPDPFLPGLSMQQLPECGHSPVILSDHLSGLERSSIFADLKKLPLVNEEILSTFVAATSEDLTLMNSLILFLGTWAIPTFLAKYPPGPTSLSTEGSVMEVPIPALEIFRHLVHCFDMKNRYHLINGIVNQLRYPSSHTYYFSRILLALFKDDQHADSSKIKELVSRVLLERLVVSRPHPWGLLLTFIELMSNSQYKFWEYEFIHKTSDIYEKFRTVAESMNVKVIGSGAGGEGASTIAG